jgi:hypothetical protein
VAILLTVAALFLILTWTENYGECHEEERQGGETGAEGPGSGVGAMVQSIKASAQVIQKYPVIFFLGMSQAFFEGAVYTFGKYTTTTTMITSAIRANT